MMGENRTISGSVKILACRSCHSTLPLFEFETEADTGVIGLCSAAQCDGRVIAVAETTLEEWNAIQSGVLSSLPSRLTLSSEFKDFHISRIKRIERGEDPPAGVSFAEFKVIYKRPVVVYACPCCDDGEAYEAQELTITEFEMMGGKIIALGSFVISS